MLVVYFFLCQVAALQSQTFVTLVVPAQLRFPTK